MRAGVEPISLPLKLDEVDAICTDSRHPSPIELERRSVASMHPERSHRDRERSEQHHEPVRAWS